MWNPTLRYAELRRLQLGSAANPRLAGKEDPVVCSTPREQPRAHKRMLSAPSMQRDGVESGPADLELAIILPASIQAGPNARRPNGPAMLAHGL